MVDLQTEEGAALVGGQWRYADARVEEIDFVELGSAEDPLGPGDVPNRTYDVVPHAEAPDFDDSAWRVLAPAETMRRLGERAGVVQLVPHRGDDPRAVGDLDADRLDGRLRGGRSTTTPRSG